MSISYESSTGIFFLDTSHTSYRLKADEHGFLLHLYYGNRISGNAEEILSYDIRGFINNPHDLGSNRSYSLSFLPQEFPYSGTGDYRSLALKVETSDRVSGTDLRYVSHSITHGKYHLDGLPSVYSDRADTLDILLRDELTGLTAHLLYGVLEDEDIITRAVILENEGDQDLYVTSASSACIDFVTGDYDIMTFNGRHMMERIPERTPLQHHSVVIGSRRGTSSHQHNPMMIVCDGNTDEDRGNCYALSLVYSGGFEAIAERDQIGQTRILMGLSPDKLSYLLSKGKKFIVPEVILTFSNEGLNRLSQNLHRVIRDNICRGKYKYAERPVLINSWEAAYFNINAEALTDFARNAADLGIEMLVMDDGWFGRRDDDTTGLGDWYVNEKKLGMPLKDLISKISGYGLKFGLWFEPEMICEDSDLYRAHPDYALKIPGRDPILSRSQLVLDFSRQEVADNIFEQMCRILDDNRIDYLKLDMNRSIAEVYSHDTPCQGNVLYDYCLGLYRFMERLSDRYPDILIEGCSGGGGRFDAGFFHYVPQAWCSDNTDAVDRVLIQYGTSFGYPVSVMTSHVSAVPNHQTGRITSLETRGIVAMSGILGYEMDPASFTPEEKETVRAQIATFKEDYEVITRGLYYRLSDPLTDPVAAWAVVSEDQSCAIISMVRMKTNANMPNTYIRLRGLKRGARYIDSSGHEYDADILLEAGLKVPYAAEEYKGYRIKLTLRQE